MKTEGRFIPYPFTWEDMPLDISYLFDKEKPAGKHGFVKVDGDRMVFADGNEARFWGVGFQGSSMFPAFECSKKVARRLAKTGVNMVRFHQMDAEWATPNLFQFTKGKRLENTLNFDPESLKRLDYFVYCLKREGIYILMENLSYRKFKTGDGVVNAKDMKEGAKPYCYFSRKLIQLQKKYIEDLWNHTNPYTGLAYKDDPAIACTNINNESGLTCRKRVITVEPYRTELEEMYALWQKKKGFEAISLGGDFTDFSGLMEFFVDVEKDYYREMICFMRDIGIKVPITGTNWVMTAGNKEALLVTDYDENHGYWTDNFGLWNDNRREFENQPMVTSIDNHLARLAFGKSLDRPMLITEWLDCQPIEWRAESIPFMAAVSAFQKWSGFIVHAYRYTAAMKDGILTKDFYTSAVGDFYIREGMLSIYNDPAMFGLFYHAALLYRRGDARSGNYCVDVLLEDRTMNENAPGFQLLAEKHRTGVVLRSEDSNADSLIRRDEIPFDSEGGEVVSDTDELCRNWKEGFGYINTAMTKVAYGFLGKKETHMLNGLTIKVNNDFAVVAVSSLTEEPINRSKCMLLTTVGRAENTDVKYNEEHNKLLDFGRPPVTIEVIETSIRLKTTASNLTVWAITPEGFYQGILPSRYEDGVLEFETGRVHASMYYMIIAE